MNFAHSLPRPRPVADAAPRPEPLVRDTPLSPATAIRLGDADAFEAFYRDWYPRVVALARAASRRDESFALDVAQEVMLRAARSLPACEGEAPLNAWMSRTTLRVVIDHLRRDTRRARRETFAAGHESAPAAPLQDTHALAEALARELRELPLAEYEALRARLLEGRTLAQTARACDTSVPAVHGRVRRTLDSLRAAAARFIP